jgi:hypothetical protein
MILVLFRGLTLLARGLNPWRANAEAKDVSNQTYLMKEQRKWQQS